MWKSFKCRRLTGESGYMGFAANYENVLAFLLEVPDGTGGDYYKLIRNNRENFNALYTYIEQNVKGLYHSMTTAKRGTAEKLVENCEQNESVTKPDECGGRLIKLVEPRELLNLLNFIEVYHTRLLYAPRPFYRSNIFCMTSLVQMDDSSLIACFFCGKQSAYHRSKKSVCFTTVALTEPLQVESRLTQNMNIALDIFNVPEEAVGRVMFNNDLDAGQREHLSRPVFDEIQQLHHEFCPVMWLHHDRNAEWGHKDSPFTVRGVSKFHHLMQFLTVYPRPRENASWLCLINRLSKCETPGASQHTLDKLFRIVCHERLVMSKDRVRAPPLVSGVTTASELYSEPMHVNAYVSEAVNLSDEDYAFNDLRGCQLGDLLSPADLPYGGSCTVLPLVEQEMISARANTLLTHRAGETQSLHADDSCTAENAILALKDGTVSGLQYYRMLYIQGFLVPVKGNIENLQMPYTQHHVCLCCGAVYRNTFCGMFEESKHYFEPGQLERLLTYALYGARGDTNDPNRHVYGRYLPPVPHFEALLPTDLQAREQRCQELSERLKQALTWLCTSMDSLHSDYCVFRIKKRAFSSESCPICFEPYGENDKRAMTCGHQFCARCYNEITMTDCCICKRGYRTELLSTSDSVIRGYLERSNSLV